MIFILILTLLLIITLLLVLIAYQNHKYHAQSYAQFDAFAEMAGEMLREVIAKDDP